MRLNVDGIYVDSITYFQYLQIIVCQSLFSE